MKSIVFLLDATVWEESTVYNKITLEFVQAVVQNMQYCGLLLDQQYTVILFSNEAKIVDFGTLNKNERFDKLRKLEFDMKEDTATRNITSGLEKAFHILESSAPDVEGRVILLITHGPHNAAGPAPGIISNEIKTKSMFNIPSFTIRNCIRLGKASNTV